MQKKKKGFTLVELLVVIAILAILAAVSVVGYLSFTEKAKESNDNTLVTQLNTVLQADEASDGKPKTMSDALDVLKENGFLVENLTPNSAKNEFLYNLKENRFEIKTQDEVKNLNNGDYWYIIKDETSLNDMKDNCSLYLIEGLSLTNTEILDIKYGFDSLNNSVTKLTVKNEDVASNIVLNTNAANIEINAADDNVSHYGTADNVTVTAVANNSYHEYGIVNRVEVTSGHIEFMPNSKVNEIYVTSNNVNITITDKVQEYDKINIILSSGVVLPEGSIAKPEGSNDVITETVVSNYDELKKGLDKKGSYKLPVSSYVKLKNDILITESLGISGTTLWSVFKRINLNGFTLKFEKFGRLQINPDVNFSICNGKIDYSNKTNCISVNGDIDIKSMPIVKIEKIQLNNIGNATTAGGEAIETSLYHNIVLNECEYSSACVMFKTNEQSQVTINSGSYEILTRNYNLIENNGKLIINGGTFKGNCDSSNTAVIKNSGNLIVNDGEFISPKGATIFNQGHATLNGGRFISKSCSLCNKNEATGKTHYVYSIYSGGNNNTFITINEGTYIEGIHGGLAVTSGGAEINGGKIVTVECPTHKTTSHYALYLAGEVAETNIIINGGEFTSFDKVAMYVGNSNDGGNKEHARVTVKDGTFNGGGDKTAIKVDSSLGYLNVLGGKYSSDISKVANLNVKTTQNGNYWVVA